MAFSLFSVWLRYIRWNQHLLTFPFILVLYTCFAYLLSFMLSRCPNFLNIPSSTLIFFQSTTLPKTNFINFTWSVKSQLNVRWIKLNIIYLITILFFDEINYRLSIKLNHDNDRQTLMWTMALQLLRKFG